MASMGSGASKKDGAGGGAGGGGDFEDEDAALEVDFQRQLDAKRQLQRRQLKKQKDAAASSRAGGAAAAAGGPPKVVGLDDSDDEGGGGFTSHAVQSVEEDDDIREMDSLNRTFGSLGIAARDQRRADGAPVSSYSEGHAAAGGDETDEFMMSHSATGHTRFGPGMTVGRRPSLVAGRRPSMAAAGPGGFTTAPPPTQAAGGRANFKFSWEGNKAGADKESEEWTYKRVGGREKKKLSCATK